MLILWLRFCCMFISVCNIQFLNEAVLGPLDPAFEGTTIVQKVDICLPLDTASDLRIINTSVRTSILYWYIDTSAGIAVVLNESRPALISRAPFGYPDWGFPWFSSVIKQMPGYRMQSRDTARTPLSQTRRLHLSAWQKSPYLQFATEPAWAQNPDSQPTKVIPPINSLGPPRQ
jgi:hypothetical protein